MTEVPTSTSRRRRITSAIALSGALGTIGAVTLGSIGGSAQARDDAPALEPGITVGTVVPPTLVTVPPLTIVTVPPTLITVPPLTIVTIPPLTIATTTTEETTTTTTTAQTTTTTTEPPSTAPATEAPETSPQSPSGDTTPPFLVIHSASVDCAGVIHVDYETGGLPEPAPTANHLIVTNPLSNPTAFAVQETTGQPVNRVFDVSLQAPTAESYRLFVTADFLPDDPDDLVLADQVDAMLDPGCPPPTTTTAPG